MSEDRNGIDWQAAHSRLEGIVTALAKSYVTEGWKLDRKAANRALAYLERHAADSAFIASDEETDPKGFTEFLNFMKEHGQCLNYVLGGDTEGMACMLAAQSKRALKRAA